VYYKMQDTSWPNLNGEPRAGRGTGVMLLNVDKWVMACQHLSEISVLQMGTVDPLVYFHQSIFVRL
jgi:hypothetical protein